MTDRHNKTTAKDSPDVPDDADLQAVWDAIGLLSLDDVAALDAPVRKPARYTTFGVWGALAATLVVAVCGYGMWRDRPLTYQSAIGEQKTVALADGSHVTLNTNSRIEVRVRRNKREVALVSGEAFFDVAHKPDAQPFYVVSAQTRVRVTGTRFDVSLRPDRMVDVSLLEGHVRTGNRRDKTVEGRGVVVLSPGEAVRMSAEGLPVARYPAARLRIENWLEHRVYFADTPLAEALNEMNRYNPVPIRLSDRRLETIRVSGIFDAGDSTHFVMALQKLYGVDVKATDNATELSR
jgi:transmembrane sensor